MKREKLEKHLRNHGCQIYREGSKHALWWNPQNRHTSTIPRHREINEYTAKKICRDLEVDYP